jgi:BirA family transcriptional regulator, biotin operon repressor / biotin---[acetyl-CoA-carboxylase] ligase
MFTRMAGDRASDRADQAPVSAAPQAHEVRAALAGTRFADVRWTAETGSTNADALDLARDGAAEGIVVVADHQSAGRGRRDRTWVAPPGASLLVSVLLRPPATVAPGVTMAVAVAMAEAVAATAGVEPGLKWPNDLVVDDRKLAGVLAEADWPAGSAMSAGWRAPAPYERVPVVVGVGLNVRWPALRAPDPDSAGRGQDDLAALAETATALNWLGADVDRPTLLAAFLRRLDDHYGELVSSRSLAGVLAGWRRRSATLGRRVRVDLGPDDVEGTAVDVTDEGHLVVETLEGVRRTFAVGDVVHLRPA